MHRAAGCGLHTRCRKQYPATGPLSMRPIRYRSGKRFRIVFNSGRVNHSEGFFVRLRIVAAFSMTLGILAATMGFAVPAAAAPAAWVMPDVRGVVLQGAINAIQEVTGSAKLNFIFVDTRNGQEVHNKSNWVVCQQNPRPEGAISKKSKKVYLYVKRFNQKSCWR